LNLRGLISDEAIGRHFSSIIDNNTVSAELVAMPWFADAPSLFYRTDLLAKYGYAAPPQTWSEMEEMAVKIMEGERQDGNLGFWGYAFQGGPYEGLTCNALEWQYSNGGGKFVDARGQANLLNEGALRGIKMGASWIGKISPPETVNFDEEESRLVWQRGDVAFLRNWSYVYSLTKKSGPIGKSFSVTTLPGGPEGRAATLGGWQLMVSRYSQHPKEAVALVEFLTSPDEQKLRAVEGSYLPTIGQLYSDPDVLKSNPYFEGFEAVYTDLVTRPSTRVGARYDQVSSVYSRAVYEILKGEPEEARLAAAETEINDALK
jgi:trehalose/maltose transport system substrate-binding protein